MKFKTILSKNILIIAITLAPSALMSQCSQIYNWATWNNFSSNSATGTINSNGQIINVTMSANYQFGSTNDIFGYSVFNGFNGTLPANSTSPETTWSIGAGGITTMCFSQTVSNPILLLASIGRSGTPVTLTFSRAYISIYAGQNVQYVNDTTIIGEEGYTILMFPGNFDCVEIFSTTPEYYTNITWGLNPPLFPVSILGDSLACSSATLTAYGGNLYSWSGGESPNSATNTFNNSGTYFLTVTDNSGCTVITSQTIEIIDNTSFVSINESICQGQNYINYTTSGVYIDTLQSVNGCDSIVTLELIVNPSYKIDKNITICSGSFFEFNGEIISQEGVYIDSMDTQLGCDSIIVLNLKIAHEDFLGNDTTICNAYEYTLKSPSEQTVWFDNSIGLMKKVNKPGVYWASIIGANGCEIIDTVFVQFNIKSYMPNVFSPNGDGINDCFNPFFSQADEIAQYRFSVFDRWGNHIFTTSDTTDCWNGESKGKVCTNGVYVYFLEITTENCGKTISKGDITLVK